MLWKHQRNTKKHDAVNKKKKKKAGKMKQKKAMLSPKHLKPTKSWCSIDYKLSVTLTLYLQL